MPSRPWSEIPLQAGDAMPNSECPVLEEGDAEFLEKMGWVLARDGKSFINQDLMAWCWAPPWRYIVRVQMETTTATGSSNESQLAVAPTSELAGSWPASSSYSHLYPSPPPASSSRPPPPPPPRCISQQAAIATTRSVTTIVHAGQQTYSGYNSACTWLQPPTNPPRPMPQISEVATFAVPAKEPKPMTDHCKLFHTQHAYDGRSWDSAENFACSVENGMNFVQQNDMQNWGQHLDSTFFFKDKTGWDNCWRKMQHFHDSVSFIRMSTNGHFKGAGAICKWCYRSIVVEWHDKETTEANMRVLRALWLSWWGCRPNDPSNPGQPIQ